MGGGAMLSRKQKHKQAEPQKKEREATEEGVIIVLVVQYCYVHE
jgi:hypothetical protein